MRGCFDSELYLGLQKRSLLERSKGYRRVYVEFGGKLFDDAHAFRVLPGYKRDLKVSLLSSLSPVEVVYCVSAFDLSSRRRVGSKRLSYASFVLRELSFLKKKGLRCNAVVITRFSNQQFAVDFSFRLRRLNYKVYFHEEIPGYPKVKNVSSFLRSRSYVPFKSRFVVITGAGGGSGKFSFVLSQLLHDRDLRRNSLFLKSESFPIAKFSLSSPLNLAYEAATADLGDKNVVDRLHKKAFGVSCTSYNRDVENFLLLQRVLGSKRPFGYRSPTMMGVNMIPDAITNLSCCEQASRKEIFRREREYFREFSLGRESDKTLKRMVQILRKVR